MAVRFGGWNEGSLLRRTLLHVAAFVMGSVAFVGIASLVLVAIAKAALPGSKSSAKADSSVVVPFGSAGGARGKPAAGKTSKRPATAAKPTIAGKDDTSDEGE